MLAKIAFKGDVREMVTTLNGLRAVDARPAAIANLDNMLSDARKRAGAPLLIAGWENRGRANSRITIFPAPRDGDLSAMRLIYNGATGELIRERPMIGMKPSLGASLLGLVARFISAISPDGGRAPCGSRSARPAPMWPGAD